MTAIKAHRSAANDGRHMRGGGSPRARCEVKIGTLTLGEAAHWTYTPRHRRLNLMPSGHNHCGPWVNWTPPSKEIEVRVPNGKRLSAITLCVAIFLASCGSGATTTTGLGGGDTGTTAVSGEMTSFTFAFPSQNAIQYHPFYVADFMGYFEEEGLEVSFESVDGSSAVMQQLIAGNADAGLPSGPAFSQGVAQDNCMKLVYAYSYLNVFDIAAPVDSGITSIEDLAGKTIGISEAGGGEVPLVRAVLAAAGLTEGTDVQLIEIGEGGALTFDALQNDRAQAYSSSLFDIASIAAAGLETQSILPEDYRYFPSNSIVVTCDVMSENSEVITGFARAVAKGTVFSQENPDAAREIAESYQPELFEDEALATAFWDATIALATPPEAIASEPLGTPYREGWETYIEFASQGTEEEGALPPDSVDLDQVLDGSLLGDINDFDREAVVSDAQAFEGVNG